MPTQLSQNHFLV